jgi:hypothetical protein
VARWYRVPRRDSSHEPFAYCYNELRPAGIVSCCSSVQDKKSKIALDNVRLNNLKFGHKTKTLILCHNFISHPPLQYCVFSAFIISCELLLNHVFYLSSNYLC